MSQARQSEETFSVAATQSIFRKLPSPMYSGERGWGVRSWAAIPHRHQVKVFRPEGPVLQAQAEGLGMPAQLSPALKGPFARCLA